MHYQSHIEHFYWDYHKICVRIITLYDFYESDPLSCSNIYFDKTNNLNGYELRALHMGLNSVDDTKISSHKCTDGDPEIICSILNRINASITTKISHEFGSVNERGEPFGPLKDLLTGLADFTFNPFFLRGFWKNQAYPSHTEALKIISSKESVMYFTTMVHSLTLKVGGFFVISCLVSIFILKRTLEISVLSATLEFIRMLVGASTLNEPRKLHGWIIFMSLVIACSATSTFFLSFLSAVLTLADLGPTIDSAEDLMNSDLGIYGGGHHRDLIWHETIKKRYVPFDSFRNCTANLLKGDRIACIIDEYIISYYLYENATIHISKQTLATRAAAHGISEISPIRFKFMRGLLKMGEGGFIELLYARTKWSDSVRNREATNDFEVFSIKDLLIAFFILIGVWIFASSVFLIEIITCHIKK